MSGTRRSIAMSETVLVTGGTGFVAGWCIAELLRRGYAVRATVRNLSKAQLVRAAIASAGASGGTLTFCTAVVPRKWTTRSAFSPDARLSAMLWLG